MAETLAGILPFLLLGVLMYALLILPQQRRTKAHKQLLAAIAEGDEVVTNSGIYGFVKEVEADVIWLEVAQDVELRVSKSAIASTVTAPSASDTTED